MIHRVFSMTARDKTLPVETPNQIKTIMRTMMDLLVRLQEVENAARFALRSKQLTPREKRSAQGYVTLVREIIPGEVLALYEQMKQTDTDLLDSRELFAMAVLVATYRGLSPGKRRKLLFHFSTQPCVQIGNNGRGNRRFSRIRKRAQRASSPRPISLRLPSVRSALAKHT